ncbi:hypothetical protein A5743_14320 [Mycolicibacterium conceptionense]|nr:hypothetical protein A5743_14320 [Mycolicibacterium conceptionense]
MKAQFGVCDSGHVLSPENTHWFDRDRYCSICVASGAVTPSSRRRVYFITDGSGHVKIGSARDVRVRLEELQIGNPAELTVLADQPGGLPRERELHRRFAEHRVRGEWFRLLPEIVEYIASIPSRETHKVPEYVQIQRDLIKKQEAVTL